MKPYVAVLASARAALAGIGAPVRAQLAAAARFVAGRSGKVVTSGIGKSGFIAAKVAATFTSLGIPAVYLHPADALHGDIGIVHRQDTLIAFSHSGATKELVGILKHIPAPVVAVTGAERSRLSSHARLVVAYRIAREGSPHGLAPMASTTASLVLGDMLAAQVAALRGFTPARFAELHPSGSLGLQLAAVSSVMLRGRALPLVRSSDTFVHALKTISAKKLGITGVCDARGRLVGALSDGDIRRFIQSGAEVSRATAADAMSQKPKTIPREESLKNALAVMEKYKVTSLFVMKGAHAEGIVHLHSILERQLR